MCFLNSLMMTVHLDSRPVTGLMMAVHLDSIPVNGLVHTGAAVTIITKNESLRFPTGDFSLVPPLQDLEINRPQK